MLSKFSKLPGLNFLSSNPQYPQESIDAAICDIKSLGKKQVNGEESLKDIQKILFYMKQYQNIQIQRVACHALSNLAMQVVAARWIIQKGGFELIKKALYKYSSDHKLCWLASSAIWNLARPPTNRNIIGKTGCKLMLKVLNEHSDREKVTNTAIGALSNLSLLESLKDYIASPKNLKIILNVMAQYLSKSSISVMTSGAGLIANLAVSDEHATTLVESDVIPVLLKLLLWEHKHNSNNSNPTTETLFRNTCAALNNLVTADEFLNKLLLSRGIEVLYRFLKLHKDNELYFNLLENCLVNIDCDPNKTTTSFHIAAFHNKLDILKNLIIVYYNFNLDAKDQNGMSLLDYAMTNNPSSLQINNENEQPDENKLKEMKKLSLECVKLLTKCGATTLSKKNKDNIDQDILDALEYGTKLLKKLKIQNGYDIENTDYGKFLPTDLCNYLTTFQSNIDLLEGANEY
jgi:hypothetical protein